MQRLAKLQMNTYILNYTRLKTLTSDKSCTYCLTKHVSDLYNLKHFRRLLTIPQFDKIKLDPYYYHCKLENINQFSTTNKLSKSKDRGKDKKKSSNHVDLNELAEVIDADQLISQYEKAIEVFKDQMIKYLVLRSSAGAIEQLRVKFEGDEYNLEDLAQISRKPKIIVLNLSAFPQTIPAVLESLSKTQMNINPQQDGTTLYIPIPKVTKEHRENLAKNAKAYFVRCRDNITDVRNKYIKNVKKDKELAVDLAHRIENYIDILSKKYIDEAEELLEMKRKELIGSE